VEDHAHRQYQAEVAGRWHATQLDLNDELAEYRARIASEAGELEAERFMRIYAEEVLAYERDFRSNPRAGARRMAREEPPVNAMPPAALIGHVSRPVMPLFIVFIIIGAAALLF
jgi:hypothetical protein